MSDTTRPCDTHGEPVRFSSPDGFIAARRWGRRGARRLLFCHATGFCASAYRAVLAALADGFELIALDLRGHGRSALPADPATLNDWSPFVADIAGVLDQLTAKQSGPVAVAGHSLGASCVLMAVQGRRDVAAIALIEPVVVSRIVAAAAMTPFWPLLARRIPLVRGARARRAAWPDRNAAVAGYARKQLFAAWAEGCLEDYLEDGLVAGPDGVRLACAPQWEAAVFAAQANRLWPAVAGATAPISVFVADHPGSTVSRSARKRFRRLGADISVLGGVSHLAPFEQPQAVARALAEALSRNRV